jgi:ketosteroid isomerase-like protein
MGAAENVEVVRRWFEGLQRGEQRLDLIAPDARMENIAEFPIKGPYLGKEGFVEWYEDLSDVIEDLTIELLEAEAIDEERVLTMQRMTGTFKSTGIPVDEKWIGVGRLENGLLKRVAGYTSRRQALEAVDA